jgi:uncharacterized protein YukE
VSGVQFDQQKAQAAVQALSASASLLRSITDARAGMASRALDQWTGPHADRFRGQDLRRLDQEAAGIIRLLGTLRDAIENAQLQASRDQFNQTHSKLPDGRVLP